MFGPPLLQLAKKRTAKSRLIVCLNVVFILVVSFLVINKMLNLYKKSYFTDHSYIPLALSLGNCISIFNAVVSMGSNFTSLLLSLSTPYPVMFLTGIHNPLASLYKSIHEAGTWHPPKGPSSNQ